MYREIISRIILQSDEEKRLLRFWLSERSERRNQKTKTDQKIERIRNFIMKKKWISGILSAALCLTSVFSVTAFAGCSGPSTPSGGSGEGISHVQYLTGFSDSTIRPQEQVTRAQAAQMLYNVCGAEKSSGQSASFSDVAPGAWYYDAVSALAEKGILKGYQDGTFRPSQKITRAEFAAILSACGSSFGSAAADAGEDTDSAPAGFSDVAENSWYYEAVTECAEKGWITGYDGGLFKPAANTTRAESVTMINRLLGRKADRFALNMADDVRVMPDVTDSHWAYYELLEALTEHTCTIEGTEEIWTSHEPGTVDLEPGWHNIGGELFHVNANHCFDYRTEVDGLELNVCGRYTTGDAELDAALTAAAKEAFKPGMTQEERLRAMYDYAMDTFGYRGAQSVETGSTGWEMDIAKTMFKSKKGNCYSWAAAYTYLARKAGYPATAIAGESINPKGNQSVHAWTEIVIDGVEYTFDPEIEAVYAANYGENYDLYRKPYGTTPFTYVKPVVEEPEDPSLDPSAVDEKLAEILTLVYDGVESPMTAPVPLNRENETYYIGASGLDYRAGIGSDAMIISIPHSVVIVEMKEGADIEAAKESIRSSADGRKWICVGVEDEDIRVESIENYILLVMSENSEAYTKNFMKHKDEILALQ